MIIVRLKGGLGNQMFQYALGCRLAFDRKVLVRLDTTWFASQSLRSYQLDRFQINAAIATPQAIAAVTKSNWRGMRARLYRAIQRRLPYYRRARIREKKISYDPNILKIPHQAYLIGYWQSEKYFKGIESIIRKEFQLRKPLSPYATTWAGKIQNCHSVSVHIRRGDYVSNPKTNKFHGSCSLEYYREAADYILQKVPGSKFFIFSDDIDWSRVNINFLNQIEYVEVEGDTRDEEELILMSLCQHHILANSSYSWWGAWLGNNKEGIIVAPRKWFNDPMRDTSHLIPQYWKRLAI